MKTAIAWVKDSLSSKGLASNHLYYLIKGGFIFATDGRMTVSHPFPCPHDFCASGPELEKLIERLVEPIHVEVGQEIVTLKSGRSRGSIKCIDPAEWTYPTVAGERRPVPTRLLPALKQIRPFISDNASQQWALCVRAANDTLYATNNVSAVAAPDIDLDGVDALIPYWAIDFILARPGMIEWSHGDGFVAFYWENGAWLRTQLIADNYPTTIEAIIDKAGFASDPISDEWRASFDEVSALIDDYVIFRADKMTGTNKNLDVEVEAITKTPEGGYSAWALRYLMPVVKCATHFNPGTYPNPSPFRGDGILGVVVGRQV